MPSLNPAKYVRFLAKIYRLSRPARGRTELSYVQQVREIYDLLRLNGLEPEEYYRYEFYDPRYTWEGKKTYLSRRQQVVLERALNPINEEAVLNKFLFKLLAQRFGIAVPDMYGLYNDRMGFTLAGDPLRTSEDLARLIPTLPEDDFLLKPVSGGHGWNILLCRRLGNDRVAVAGEGDLTFGELAERMTGTHSGRFKHVLDSYLVEARVRQHPFFNSYTDSCTQSCRIVLLSTRNGELPVIAAVFKIGMAGKFVDNVGQTGIAARIDANGVLGPGIRMTPDGMRFFDTHPETGFPITGQTIPGFSDAVAMARKAQGHISQLRLIGWDVAITENGPVIFEGNNYWAWEMMQRGSNEGLLRGELEKEVRLLMH